MKKKLYLLIAMFLALMLLISCGQGIAGDVTPEDTAVPEEASPEAAEQTEKTIAADGERTVLTIGYSYSGDTALMDAVKSFNKSQRAIYVTVKGYESEEARRNAAESGETDLLLDTDLMLLREYARDGLLLDLEKEVPSLFEEGILLQNVVDALRTGGICYSLPRTFSVFGFSMPESYLGGKEVNTYPELINVLEKQEGEIRRYTKEELFAIFNDISFDHWIDWDNFEAHFDDEDFVALLEFCDLASKDFEEAAENKSYLRQFGYCEIAGTQASFGFKDFGIQPRVILPINKNGIKGLGIAPSAMLAIAKNGMNQEAAAAFMEYVFKESTFEDEELIGTYLKLPLNQEQLFAHFGENDEVKKIRDYITGADYCCYSYLSEPMIWCREEAEKYFKGEVTAREAAENTRKLVQSYLDDLKG